MSTPRVAGRSACRTALDQQWSVFHELVAAHRDLYADMLVAIGTGAPLGQQELAREAASSARTAADVAYIDLRLMLDAHMTPCHPGH